MNPHKVNIFSLLQLIADKDSQSFYQKKAPFVNVSNQMCNFWFDDFYHPDSFQFIEAFSKSELDALQKFNSLFELYVDELPNNIDTLHVHYGW
jgi:hypothetical protein